MSRQDDLRRADWGQRAVIAQVTGAVVRAIFVVLLISTPSLMLPDVSSEAKQIVSLVAIFAAALTIFEYSASYPGLVEFRDAPPFNRIRFASMLVTVFLLSMIIRAQSEPSSFALLIEAVGTIIGQAIDFPYSPVRLVVLMLPEGTSPEQISTVRTAAGLSYLISLISLAMFAIVIRVKHWPTGNGAFNVWVNLPTFDPTAGGDVVNRLARDARFNVAFGFLLPFLIPAAVRATTSVFDPVSLENPQTLIWTVSAWALLPASLFMRGIAIARIADMIREQRRRAAPVHEDEEDHALIAA